jgi:hypothetical protein
MTKKLLILLILISLIGITSCKTVETPRPIQVPTFTMERPSKPIIKAIEQDTAVKDLVLALTQVMGYSDRQDAFIDYYESYLADIIEILQR